MRGFPPSHSTNADADADADRTAAPCKLPGHPITRPACRRTSVPIPCRRWRRCWKTPSSATPSETLRCAWTRRLTYRDIDQLSAALGAWLQSLGLERGDARGADDAQRAAVPGGAGRRAAGRASCGRQRQSAVHGARTRSTNSPTAGAKVRDRAGELRGHRWRRCIEHCPCGTWCWPRWASLLGFWRGRLINFAVRHVRRMVPEFRLPLDGGRTVTRFNDALDRRALA
jgi:hypothetical protein